VVCNNQSIIAQNTFTVI